MKFISKRSSLALGVSAIALSAVLALGAPASAASDTSTLRGHVSGAAAGATVTAIDATTGQRVTVSVAPDGTYVIPGLRPSTYHVEVSGGPPQDVVLPVGQTVTVDLSAGGAAGTTVAGVVVTGRRRPVEVRTPEVATNVSTAQIENLPQNDRNFLNFAALAPGVVVNPNPNSKQFSAGGLSADAVNVYIDGQSFKNQVGHGGVAGQNFSQGNPFPQLAIQEFKVDTQNFKAEYEQAGSAIITAVTKTGGEQYHGDIFYEIMPKSFYGRPYFDRPGHANNPTGSNPKPDFNRAQYGFDIGGPIIKDKLHFFIAYEGTDQTNPAHTVTLGTPLPAGYANAAEGSFADKFKQDLWFAKLTFFATDADTFNLSYFNRKEHDQTDYGGTAIREHGHDLLNSTDEWLLEWRHRGRNWLNELSLDYQTSNTGTPNLTNGPELNFTAGVNGPTVLNAGGNFFQQADNQKIPTLRETFTYTGLHWNGDHVIKLGLKLDDAKLTREENWFTNGSYTYNSSTYTGTMSSSVPYRATVSIVPSTPSTASNKQVGAFLQDDWTYGTHWTFNLGIRWDYESNMMDNDFVTPQKIVTALQNYPGWQAAGINPADYISTGSNRHPYMKEFQPRLGVAYDVYGDRDLVFFAGAGRYYDRDLFVTAQIERLTDTVRSDTTVSFVEGGGCAPNANGSLPAGCLHWSPSYSDVNALRAAVAATGQGGNVWLLPNKIIPPYSDEFDVGVRKRFGDVQTAITFSHIHSENIFQYVRGNRLPNGQYTSQGNDWVEDLFPPSGQLAGFNGKLNIGAYDGKANYNAIYLTVEKPFTPQSWYGYTASITLTDAKTNDAAELSSDEMYAGASQTVFGWQHVPGVDRFRFVGTGIVRGPWGTTLSTTITLASGGAFGQAQFLPNPPEQACCKINNGGVFFPHSTLAYKNVDVRVAKDFKLWNTNLTAYGEVFNLFDNVNRTYSTWGSGATPGGRGLENGTVGIARSFQVGVKYHW